MKKTTEYKAGIGFGVVLLILGLWLLQTQTALVCYLVMLAGVGVAGYYYYRLKKAGKRYAALKSWRQKKGLKA
jgi:thiamine transporter ThiT